MLPIMNDLRWGIVSIIFLRAFSIAFFPFQLFIYGSYSVRRLFIRGRKGVSSHSEPLPGCVTIMLAMVSPFYLSSDTAILIALAIIAFDLAGLFLTWRVYSRISIHRTHKARKLQEARKKRKSK